MVDQAPELSLRQQLLGKIRDILCDGNAAELARRLDKDPTYINRLFYPKDKPGHKGIGLSVMDAANAAFKLPAGFWDIASPDTAETLLKGVKRAYAWPADVAPPAAGEPRTAYGMTPILAWEHEGDLPEGDFVMIPRLDVHLSAGGGRDQVAIELTKDNPQAFRTEWIRLMRLRPAKLAAMRASGESMEPTIHDGDSLLVDTSQTDVADGKVYALWYDGGERVKRLFRLPGGGLRIHSDNKDKDMYPDITLRPEELEHVRVIGRVVHRSGTGGL